MGRLGAPELVIVVAVILVVTGGKRLPDVARGLGQALREFRAAVGGEQPRSAVPHDSGPVDSGGEAPNPG